ncbi:MAG: c-type cytochrome [Ilyomonas sp.]
MTRITSFFVFILLLLTSFSLFNFASATKNKIENTAPVVKIISPKNNSSYKWNTQVSYSISVSDKEDGESKYDEINGKEVVLRVKYFSNAADANASLSEKINEPGLTNMQTSNCFNCHDFNAKVIGPSFNEISKRYTNTKSNFELLVKHIEEGSVGVWGKVKMPSHPELSQEQTQKMVEWILKNTSDPNVNYYTGTEGSFWLKAPGKQQGAFLLTATYTDHGSKEEPKQNLSGQDAVVVTSKE